MARGYTTYTFKQGDTISEVVDKFKSGRLFETYFKVDQELTWEQVWYDANNNNFRNISNENMKTIPIGAVVYLPYQGTEIELNIPLGKEIHLKLNTNDRIRITPLAFLPIVDIHIHVESLHATPLPVMWGAAYLNGVEKWCKNVSSPGISA